MGAAAGSGSTNLLEGDLVACDVRELPLPPTAAVNNCWLVLGAGVCKQKVTHALHLALQRSLS